MGAGASGPSASVLVSIAAGGGGGAGASGESEYVHTCQDACHINTYIERGRERDKREKGRLVDRVRMCVGEMREIWRERI